MIALGNTCMKMKTGSQRVLAVACILIACVMPVEWGTKAEDDVTPAPTVVVTDWITVSPKPEVLQNPTESKISEGDQLPDPAVKEFDTTNVPSDIKGEFLEKDNDRPQKHSKRKAHPVCKYSMREIFLFGQDSEGSLTTVTNKTLPTPAADLNEVEVVTQAVVEIDAVSKQEKEVKLEDDAEEANMKLKVTDVHSFEEWKNLKLQEQESKLADNEPTPSRTVRAKKTQVNYGSQDCGAKILAHNKEAKHVSAILDENRDLYMLNPCSNPIWFVVELCEPIQVQQVQIGNLELFSSAPKEFSVSVSERYPTREWHLIGAFEATNDRNLQSFNVKSNDVMFAKYIKFEMKSHFSNEHFCPLTLVRVMGISMVDEFDESEQTNTKSDSEEENSHSQPGAIVDDAQQNENGPINAMLNMVKNAIGLNDVAQNEKAENDNEIIDNLVVANETDTIDLANESEVTLVTNHTEIGGQSGGDASLITLIEVGNGEDLSLYVTNLTAYSPHIPIYVPKFIQYLTPVTRKLNARVCWFLEFVCKVSLTSCLVHYPFNYSGFVPFSMPAKENPMQQNVGSVQEESNVQSDDTAGVEHNVTDVNNVNASSDSVGDSKQDIPETELNKTDLPIVGQTTPLTDYTEDNHFPPSKNIPDVDLVSEEPVKVDSCEINGDAASTTKQQVISAETKKEEPVPLLEPVKLNGSTVTEENQSGSVMNDVKIPNSTEKNSDKDPVDESAEKQKPVDYTAERLPPQHAAVINPVSPKDSVFMRLSNRIRVLEQNMSLSSDYLENLSRRYKEQMDEMQRAFDKTTSKLVATSRTANENDAKQTELLKKAEAEIEILKVQIQNLFTAHDQLNSKLVERHLCLIVLELFLFVAVFVTCLGRRMARTQRNLEASNDMIERLTGVLRELKNSRTQDTVSNGHCYSVPANTIDTPTITSDTHQQKKKKKKAKRKNSNGSSSTAESAAISSISDRLQCTDGVETIGPKLTTACVDSPLENPDKAWNAGQVGLKIPATYVKGRK